MALDYDTTERNTDSKAPLLGVGAVNQYLLIVVLSGAPH